MSTSPSVKGVIIDNRHLTQCVGGLLVLATITAHTPNPDPKHTSYAMVIIASDLSAMFDLDLEAVKAQANATIREVAAACGHNADDLISMGANHG